MSGPGGAGPDPPLTGGEFLLSLLQKSPQHQQQRHYQHHQQQQIHQVPDPAIAAAFGPLAFHPNNNNWSQLPPNFYGLPGTNQPPQQWTHTPAHLQGFAADSAAASATSGLRSSDNGGLGLGFQPRQEPLLTFGSFPAPIHNRDTLLNGNLMNSRNVGLPTFPTDLDRNGARPRPPPGFIGAGRGVERRDLSEGDLAGMRILGDLGLGMQLDHPGPPAGSKLHSVGASDVEESMRLLHAKVCGEKKNALSSKDLLDDDDEDEIDELSKKIGDSLGMDDVGVNDNSKKFIKNRDKDARSDTRGHQLLNQRQRIYKRQIKHRADILRLDAPLIAIYDSLIPSEEEKSKQKQLLCLLERLVNREWPNAKLYIYGSCANSFGVSKSDIDICFALEGADNNKPEILLKLADILESDNLKNVQALVRARVPIVKLMDPATEISCDICINNVLAVVNTKLLRDYAQIDVRLRQLAFIVKHWAKSRRVNETYHGTLSSYAYVLMCIHFLQQRRPAILPCLQGMKTTYSVTIENVHCAFFDQVDQLKDFGHRNNESISQLVWSFFNYWAYGHDYANSVISVRTGTLLSKRGKDWTRRIGNDRHLICIEDPFETSHDLGRVVDKYSIKVLREEFERAAEVLQHDPNPCVKLFELYVPS